MVDLNGNILKIIFPFKYIFIFIINMSKLTFDQYYMNIAETVSTKSPDIIKVGAVLVSNITNKILNTGYNSTPKGIDNSKLNFNDRTFIKKIMIHAELNIVIYKNKFEDSTLYVTRSPCERCTLILAASRIKKIIYKIDHKDIEDSKKLCNFFNIELIKLL